MTEFIRKTLHVHINEDDLEAAHVLPRRLVLPAGNTASQSAVSPPTVIVRFCRRDVRDKVIRERKLLKDSKISIVEDLTALNTEVLNRLRNSDSVQKTWSWNGHIYALLKSGEKVQVKPFQTIDDCRKK